MVCVYNNIYERGLIKENGIFKESKLMDLMDKSALNHMSLEDNTHQPRQHWDSGRHTNKKKATCELVEMSNVSPIRNIFSVTQMYCHAGYEVYSDLKSQLRS